MLPSRAVPLLRQALFHQAGRKTASPITVPVRHSGEVFVYRTRPQSDPKWERASDFIGALAWWWIFWNLFTQFDHIIGEFDYVDPSQWTDEELGVPPDDYDPNSN